MLLYLCESLTINRIVALENVATYVVMFTTDAQTYVEKKPQRVKNDNLTLKKNVNRLKHEN